ncbi:hypothetical protein SARC_08391 [Sphaeroforma arctica JP610]|uniref:Proline-rich protein PRCC n=1 Tax=Sphaeroforma arctica JP610 TaxID=667725 RepID=A0A0L0FR95_9EUKA|nr:hypothetical protein SARC_08391 [Sphaeroforma arctica JP610]KNC79204.1 hypothetical protein SARC_08391 [Sphaeroforma arctica JP610]|eukprot:XP_014153106.1 hypothetical protein SARC_08391 [Sphaeroforma arctica JP610]
MPLVDYGASSDSDSDAAASDPVMKSTTDKKGKRTFTVALPHAADSDSDDGAPKVKFIKKPKFDSSGGLFSMLPAPKSDPFKSMGSQTQQVSSETTSAVDNSAKSVPVPVKANNMVPMALSRKKKAQQKEAESDGENDGTDFLASLAQPTAYADEPDEGPSLPDGDDVVGAYPGSYPADDSEDVAGAYGDDDVTGAYGDGDVTGEYGESAVTAAYGNGVTAVPPPQQRSSAMHAEAFRHLEGRGHRRTDFPADMNIIDVNASSVAGDTDRWANDYNTSQPETPMVSLAEMNADARNKGKTKQKNQITHLAAHAKANKQQLEARWASQRGAMQGQSKKYGF